MRVDEFLLCAHQGVANRIGASEFARQPLGKRVAFALGAPDVRLEKRDALPGDAQIRKRGGRNVAQAFLHAVGFVARHLRFEQALLDDEHIAAERVDGFVRHPSNLRHDMALPPLVSIVIPVYNRSSVTKSCLTALAVSGAMRLDPEVIVADDASTDDTVEMAESFPGVRVVSNAYNLGFIRNCNRAAASASGRYLVFLNNDTIPYAGWLDWLVATAEERPNAGSVGSKILLPSGKLSEAGLLIARGGVGYEYGQGGDPDAPRYNYVRPVDFNGGCSLLVRRELFYAIGGFAERYAPAYMDDFDMGLSVWERGYACLYQPRSEIVHVNFMTHGTARSEGLYRRHRPRFLRRWGAQIARAPVVTDVRALERASLEAAARHRCGARAILVVDDRPFAPAIRRELLAIVARGTHVAYAPLGGLLCRSVTICNRKASKCSTLTATPRSTTSSRKRCRSSTRSSSPERASSATRNRPPMRNPDLAPLALHVARHMGSRAAFWFGCDEPETFERLSRDVPVVGVDRPRRLAPLRQRLGGTLVETDFSYETFVPGDAAVCDGAVVVCDDPCARPDDVERALRSVSLAVERGATAFVTAPNGDPASFSRTLARASIEPTFVGRMAADDATFAKTTLLAIVEPPKRRVELWRTPPDDFRVVAIMTAFNEADVIETCLAHLIGQGVHVYLMDNYSTDDTVRLAARFLGRGLIGIEQSPLRDTNTYDLEKVLARIEHLATTLEGDWFVDYDADEIRRSAFRGVNVRKALYAVDRAGYNAVDFTVLNFRPIDDGFEPGTSLETYFTHFEFGSTPDHLRQRKAWKNLGRTPQLLEHGGHDVTFAGRKLYPYKFVNKHYPVRSQQHGERKVVRERQGRYSRREKDLRKWHNHYDAVSTVPTYVRDPFTLLRYDPESFDETYLIERLTGIGMLRTEGYRELVLREHGMSY